MILLKFVQCTKRRSHIVTEFDYLIEAFVISKAGRYDIKGRKYVGANLKYYYSDIGLRSARLNFR